MGGCVRWTNWLYIFSSKLYSFSSTILFFLQSLPEKRPSRTLSKRVWDLFCCIVRRDTQTPISPQQTTHLSAWIRTICFLSQSTTQLLILSYSSFCLVITPRHLFLPPHPCLSQSLSSFPLLPIAVLFLFLHVCIIRSLPLATTHTRMKTSAIMGYAMIIESVQSAVRKKCKYKIHQYIKSFTTNLQKYNIHCWRWSSESGVTK